MTPSSLTRPRRFSAGSGSMQKTRPQSTCIQPEPETRNGLSLARNDAFATITRSTLPPCSFASTPKTFRVPVRSGVPSLDSVSKRTGRIRHPGPVVRTNLRRCCDASRLHSPSGLSTFRIKAFDRPHHNKLASPNATVVFYSPLRSLSISPRIVAQNPFSSCPAIVP
jgi:hypothetical protein